MKINNLFRLKCIVYFVLILFSFDAFAQKELLFFKRVPKFMILDTVVVSNFYSSKSIIDSNIDVISYDHFLRKYFANPDSTTLYDSTTLFRLANDSMVGINAGWITTSGFFKVLKYLLAFGKYSNYNNDDIKNLYRYYGNIFYSVPCDAPPSMICDCTNQFFYSENEKKLIIKYCNNRFLYVSLNLYVYYQYFLYDYVRIRLDNGFEEFMKQTSINLIVPFPVCPK